MILSFALIRSAQFRGRQGGRPGDEPLPAPEGAVLRTLPDAITIGNLARAPSVAADTTGSTVVVMWSEDKSLYMASSLDGGSSFSSACAVADDVNVGHEFEAVSAFHVNGRFHVLYPNESDEIIHATLQ